MRASDGGRSHEGEGSRFGNGEDDGRRAGGGGVTTTPGGTGSRCPAFPAVTEAGASDPAGLQFQSGHSRGGCGGGPGAGRHPADQTRREAPTGLLKKTRKQSVTFISKIREGSIKFIPNITTHSIKDISKTK